MKRAYLVDDVRAAEAPLLEAGVPLMREAAYAVATTAIRYVRGQGIAIPGFPVLVLAGAGNNGSDSLFAAAELAHRGMAVRALCSDHPHQRGYEAARRAGVTIIPYQTLDHVHEEKEIRRLGQECKIWIDGLLGIGARGALREPYAQWVRILNTWRIHASVQPYVVAVDVPSGVGVNDGTLASAGQAQPQQLHCSTEEVVSGEAKFYKEYRGYEACKAEENIPPVLCADVTVTMGAGKPALYLPPACFYAGKIVDVPLGFEPYLPQPALLSLEECDVRDLWVLPGHDDHKYTRGVLGILAGSQRYPGAGMLSVGAALATGVGMVRYVGSNNDVIRAYPDVVHEPGRVQAWVLGSGLDTTAEAERIFTAASEQSLPVVLDAGALSLVYQRNVPQHVILTPHEGEMASLLQARGEHVQREDIHASPAWAARKCAELTGATVVLKGAATIIASAAQPEPLYVQAGAPGWLATAGAGDVLGGIMGAMLAMHGEDISEGSSSEGLIARLASASCYIHAQAARHAAGLRSCAGEGSVHSLACISAARASVGHPITASALIDSVAPIVNAILNPVV